MRSILLAAAASLFATAVFAAPTVCPTGLKPASTAEVFFGQDPAAGGPVSAADWRAFLAAEISPRFPNGLAASDVFGKRRGPSTDFVREPSRALFIVLDNRPDDQRRLDLVRAAYKRQFHQDSVLLIEERACVSF
jgi:hypothetical protein